MKRIDLMANAKLNLTLDIMEPPAEGELHPIVSLMHTIDWCDYLRLVRSKDATSTINEIPGIEDNLALKAAEIFSATFGTNGVQITLTKHIPMGAGLGGGSSDAAAVLKGMAVLYDIPQRELLPLAIQLGSDVPFFLMGGFARVSGTGEVVEPMDDLPLYYAVVIPGNAPLSTAEVYAKWDELKKKPAPIDLGRILPALQEGRYTRLFTVNNLAEICKKLEPSIDQHLQLFKNTSASHIAMTGAGSSVYALFTSLEDASLALERCPKGSRLCWLKD